MFFTSVRSNDTFTAGVNMAVTQYFVEFALAAFETAQNLIDR